MGITLYKCRCRWFVTERPGPSLHRRIQTYVYPHTEPYKYGAFFTPSTRNSWFAIDIFIQVLLLSLMYLAVLQVG